MSLWLVLALAALMHGLTGCARHEPTRIAIDAPPPGVHSFFVVAYGFHTGLAVRAGDVPEAAWPARRDFPDADFLVIGWGEREYYPRDEPGIWLALRALFTPARSTVNVIPVAGPITRAFRDTEVIELRVPGSGFQRMVEFVRETHELDAHGRGIVIPSDLRDQGRFYASPRTFHALENCNTWVARALQRAGLPVQPEMTLTAGSLLRQVRPLSPAPPGPGISLIPNMPVTLGIVRE
jgi:uncharacterized protein (TIGR02117 family)